MMEFSLKAAHAALLISAISLPNLAQSGMIDDQQDGWNRDNVDVYVSKLAEPTDSDWKLDNSETADPSDWDPDDPQYLVYESRIFDSTARSRIDDNELTGTHMATLVAKNPPVGEKPGVKIINGDSVKLPKPPNCIISTAYLEERSDGTGSGYLDGGNPEQVTCSSGFQTHKRYKVGMLPVMVDGITPGDFGKGVDMVFDVIAGSETQYQVFQKINNWTDSRLDGFKIEIGTGIGAGFTKAGSSSLEVSAPNTIWQPNQLANFSSGLFSPPDDKHFPEGGYFDNSNRAGFEIEEYVDQIFGDTLTATTILTPSNYPDVPTGAGNGQFGDWLPNIWLPTGIFYDEDHDPDTDNELVAWWGYNPNLTTPGYGWMTGVAEGFAEITQDQIDEWAANEWYSAGVIDDLVNVGLNYIVTIPDAYDSGSFTIRITPRKSADQTVPGFVTNAPPEFKPSDDGTIAVAPAPTFEQGTTLRLRVVDGSFANNDPDNPDEVKVMVTSDLGSLESEEVTLTEVSGDRGVFEGTLNTEAGTTEGIDNNGSIVVDIGTLVTATYNDASSGLSTDQTQAIEPVTFFVAPVPGGGAAVFAL